MMNVCVGFLQTILQPRRSSFIEKAQLSRVRTLEGVWERGVLFSISFVWLHCGLNHQFVLTFQCVCVCWCSTCYQIYVMNIMNLRKRETGAEKPQNEPKPLDVKAEVDARYKSLSYILLLSYNWVHSCPAHCTDNNIKQIGKNSNANKRGTLCCAKTQLHRIRMIISNATPDDVGRRWRCFHVRKRWRRVNIQLIINSKNRTLLKTKRAK